MQDINGYMVRRLVPRGESPLAKGLPDNGRRPSPLRPRIDPAHQDNSLRTADIEGSSPCRWRGGWGGAGCAGLQAVGSGNSSLGSGQWQQSGRASRSQPHTCVLQLHRACRTPTHRAACAPPRCRARDNDPFAGKIQRRQYRQVTSAADIEGAQPAPPKQSVEHYQQRKAQSAARQQAQQELQEAAGEVQVSPAARSAHRPGTERLLVAHLQELLLPC